MINFICINVCSHKYAQTGGVIERSPFGSFETLLGRPPPHVVFTRISIMRAIK